jgi:hypothetical protein
VDEGSLLVEAKSIIVGAFPIYRSLAPLSNSLAESTANTGFESVAANLAKLQIKLSHSPPDGGL